MYWPKCSQYIQEINSIFGMFMQSCFMLTLQETQCIHDFMNIPKLNLLLIFSFYYKYLFIIKETKIFLYIICKRINEFGGIM